MAPERGNLNASVKGGLRWLVLAVIGLALVVAAAGTGYAAGHAHPRAVVQVRTVERTRIITRTVYPTRAAAATASAPQPAATTGEPAVLLIECDRIGVTEPAMYLLACGNGAAGLTGPTWSSWTSTGATGSGKYYQTTAHPTARTGPTCTPRRPSCYWAPSTTTPRISPPCQIDDPAADLPDGGYCSAVPPSHKMEC